MNCHLKCQFVELHLTTSTFYLCTIRPPNERGRGCDQLLVNQPFIVMGYKICDYQ